MNEAEIQVKAEAPRPALAAEMVEVGTLVACDPAEMARAQAGLTEWARRKVAEVKAEAEELAQALDIATRNGWGTRRALDNALRRTERRATFYLKIEEALAAGYLVVPNFEMDIFAIRTKAMKPRGGWVRHNRNDQVAGFLPSGEGRYVSPHPEHEHYRDKEKSANGQHEYEVDHYRPISFNEVDFPMELAKPVVMGMTEHALRLTLFDEVGIARDAKAIRRGDPMILGRLRNPRPNHPDVTFFIAWAFDPRNV